MVKIDIRGKPGGFGKYLSRIPAYLYRIGFTKPFEAKILVLSTRGRKSGKIIKFPLGYAGNKNIIYLTSLHEGSDWYENTKNYPEVEIQIGKEHLKARAQKVEGTDEKARAYESIVKNQGEKNAEQFYYIKPGTSDNDIGTIGRELPVLRLEIIGI